MQDNIIIALIGFIGVLVTAIITDRRAVKSSVVADLALLVDKLKAENERLSARLSDAEKKIEKHEIDAARITVLEGELVMAHKRIAALENELSAAARKIEEHEGDGKRIARLEGELVTARDRIAALERELISTTHENGELKAKLKELGKL